MLSSRRPCSFPGAARCLRAGLVLAAALCLAAPASAQEAPEPSPEAGDPLPPPMPSEGAMTNKRLDALIRRLDPEAEGGNGQWRFQFEDIAVMVVTDSNADRMRILSPVAEMDAENADSALLYRMLQANFDSALDARYAIARGTLWSAFIHPLSPLSEREFLSGVGQTITLAVTFGTTFSSGALMYGGGDSGEALEGLHDRVIERGEAL